QQLADIALIEAGPDFAEISELAVLIGAGEQRAETVAFLRPAADDDLLAAADLGFDPRADAPRAIGRVQLLGDDAFERHFARRLEHGIALALDMRDVAQMFAGFAEQFLQPILACAQRQMPPIL